MEDRAILELFWARDERAIEATDRAYGGRLRRVAQGIVHDEGAAEESVNDTYLKAWENIPPQRPDHYFAWLATVCRRIALGRLDWNNAAKRRAEVVELTAELELCIPDRAAERTVEARELGRLLTVFLKRLPQENRLIFLRRYWYGESTREIALRFGVSEAKIKTSLHRTRARLRTYLESEGFDL